MKIIPLILPGSVRISNSLYASKLLINPEIPEYCQFISKFICYPLTFYLFFFLYGFNNLFSNNYADNGNLGLKDVPESMSQLSVQLFGGSSLSYLFAMLESTDMITLSQLKELHEV